MSPTPGDPPGSASTPPPLRWAVVVPVKAPDRAKTRLRPGVGPVGTDALALALALDTVTAALATPAVAHVLVVTDDPDVTAAVTALGADVVEEAEPPSALPGPGFERLNAAVRQGADEVRRRWPEVGTAVLTGDLGALRPDDLSRALDAMARHPRSFVADAEGTGTAALAGRPGEDLDPRFGVASAIEHERSGAVAVPGGLASLRRDVDTHADLDVGRTLGLGPHTRRLLGPRPA